MLNIIKGGLRQQVCAATYEKLYKGYGWVIDDFAPEKNKVQETVRGLTLEREIIDFHKMIKHSPRRFNDKLFKSEEIS